METIQENISRATIVEGQYAEEIRQEIMRKPSQLSILRNQKASALLKKMRRWKHDTKYLWFSRHGEISWFI